MQFSREEEITAELNLEEWVLFILSYFICIIHPQGGDCQVRSFKEEL